MVSECAIVVSAVHYSAILRRNPSTSSRMLEEKNLGNSVDDEISDNGGMCCKAFLQDKSNTKKKLLRTKALKKILHLAHYELKHHDHWKCFHMSSAFYCVL